MATRTIAGVLVEDVREAVTPGLQVPMLHGISRPRLGAGPESMKGRASLVHTQGLKLLKRIANDNTYAM
jgi:hypothetical protein